MHSPSSRSAPATRLPHLPGLPLSTAASTVPGVSSFCGATRPWVKVGRIRRMRFLDVSLPPPVLDHVVIDVRDRIVEAEQYFASLGFSLTPRGRHTLGSLNHLAMFTTDYLELLGFGEGGAARPELTPFPAGLNGLVFKTADAEEVYRHGARAGLPVLAVQ